MMGNDSVKLLHALPNRISLFPGSMTLCHPLHTNQISQLETVQRRSAGTNQTSPSIASKNVVESEGQGGNDRPASSQIRFGLVDGLGEPLAARPVPV